MDSLSNDDVTIYLGSLPLNLCLEEEYIPNIDWLNTYY